MYSTGRAGWEDLAGTVSKSENFQNAIFVRLAHPTPIEIGSPSPALKSISPISKAYQFRPGSHYRLDISVYEGTKSKRTSRRHAKLSISSSIGELIVVQPYQSVVSGVTEKSTILACSRMIEDKIAALVISVEDDLDEIVNAPNPVIFCEVAVPRRTLITFVILVFVGLF